MSEYIELSHMSAGGLVSEEMILKSLENAVTCAILAKSGPPRSRLFATLFRDERSARLPNYRILEKMYKERILRSAEVEKFEETLQPHQRATLAGGVTVLKAAVHEHNVFAASKIYKNIRMEELAGLLSLSPEQAEQVCCRMISENRLKASIDQIEGILEFESSACSYLSRLLHALNAMSTCRHREARDVCRVGLARQRYLSGCKCRSGTSAACLKQRTRAMINSVQFQCCFTAWRAARP